ncbi:M48 family metalloprotease [Catenulispora sp. NF23]|uniref:M48 family metalloprotease n=1 Tax=Catenulispora pinistramenti TaxID=2705254 RepID=UPI001BABB54B|nr:M48 family metalloprotease [Catenulispora pinistramenti]MBS2536585.1 M48 family metalloprotease [Catenulispora pinistramenti]
MNVNVYLPLLAALALGTAGPTLGRRLPPAVATVLLTAAALVTALTSLASLALLTGVVVLRLPEFAAEDRLSDAVLVHGPVSPLVGTVSGLALLALLPFAIRAGIRLWRESARTYRLAKAFSAHPASIAVIQDPRAQAFAVPGIPSLPGHAAIPTRIVATDSLLRTLDEDQRRAMFAHEQAHLHHRHHLYLLLTNLAAVANPLLWRLPDAVTEATERWADEDAAAAVGNREVLARALGRAALSNLPRTIPAMAQAHVGKRVRALMAPPPPRRRALAAIVGIAIAATVWASFQSAQEADRFFDSAHAAWHIAHERNDGDTHFVVADLGSPIRS